ncbi:MAG TPA: serine/threonine protein kinase [Pirellulaceae bacterium]|nr:serine/threonine protein kinase [Pirellulaceae bacterium]
MFRWLSSLFRLSAPAPSAAQGHLTFGATSVGRTLSRTGLLLKKQLWIWPIIAVVLLAAIGYAIRVAIERTMRANLQSQLETLLNVERSMLETWLKIQESNAESLANDQQVRETAAQILSASGPVAAAAPTTTGSPAAANLDSLHARLAQELSPGMSAHNFIRYILADKQQRIVSATSPELIGQTIPEYESFLTRALEGQVVVSPPFKSVVLMKDEKGRLRTGVPTMFVVAPVRDANFQVVAALGLRIRPEREFTRILQLGRIGESGETYAVNKSGLMVSSSRFDEDLIMLGLLPDVEDAHSILTISVRDPGGNVAEGYRPKVRRAELPLTKAAAATAAGTPGVDLDGYRDYRGVPVVGSWLWLPKYELGLITEIDHAEAYRPLTILRWAFYSMFGLLTVASIAIFVFTLVVARLQRQAQKAEIEARQLGQYRLEERIGAGAMGVVYKGRHAMLRRPTAIKMLNVDKVNEASIARFEREVQITCQLNHPSTVAIYDYGRTPEGVFYYAMEYLDGIDLQVLIDRYGPQPEGRVIRILQAICGSLYEAHSLGLVHRDIKPANVMLNRRGGEPDVVKVLDFGLVKALDDAQQARQSGGLAGTPLYMSPEAIQTPDQVDARSDLYAVGAIGYFLITGKPVFSATTLVDLCQQHITTLPEAPSQRLGRTVSAELESALLSCLEKSRAKRPQTARDLAALLDRAPTANSWSLEDGEAWWGRHERSQAAPAGGALAAASPSAPTVPAAVPPSAGAAGGTARGTLDQTMAFDKGKP